MTTTLDGRTALVTGAGRGIGRAIAIGLGRRGVRVGLLARTQRDLDEVAAEIRDDGGTAVALAADIGDADQTRSALNRLVSELGPVELLVNNAAVVWPLGPTHDVDPDAVAAAMTINVVAPMTITRRVLPGMLSAGWGRIVNVSAAIAEHPGMLAGLNTYAASKGGLEAHTLNLAAELDGTGITVNVYRPGTVDTSIHAYIRAQPREQIGASLHDVFTGMLSSGALITPQTAAESLLARLTGPRSGQIWDVSDPIPDQEAVKGGLVQSQAAFLPGAARWHGHVVDAINTFSGR